MIKWGENSRGDQQLADNVTVNARHDEILLLSNCRCFKSGPLFSGWGSLWRTSNKAFGGAVIIIIFFFLPDVAQELQHHGEEGALRDYRLQGSLVPDPQADLKNYSQAMPSRAFKKNWQ